MSTVNTPRYLELLQEFEELRALPENLPYCDGPRGVDYVGLMIRSIGGVVVEEVPKGDPDRIVYVHDELSSMLEHATHTELINLKSFLEQNGFTVLIRNDPGDVVVIIHAATFDFVVTID